MIVSRDKAGHEVVADPEEPQLRPLVERADRRLDLGRVYHVSVYATDTQGRVSNRDVKTVGASVLVTVHKLKVLNNGDK